MTESVAFHNRVYDLPLVYGNEDAIILKEESSSYSKASNSYTRPSEEDISKGTAVRVIIGRFGQAYKISAPKIDIVTEGRNPDEAWANFLVEISKREDSASLSFDIGPTRLEEIEEGLNAPEDEDWSETIDDEG